MYIYRKCLASLFAIEQTVTAYFDPIVIMYFHRLDLINNCIALAWLLVNINYHDVITIGNMRNCKQQIMFCSNLLKDSVVVVVVVDDDDVFIVVVVVDDDDDDDDVVVVVVVAAAAAVFVVVVAVDINVMVCTTIYVEIVSV